MLKYTIRVTLILASFGLAACNGSRSHVTDDETQSDVVDTLPSVVDSSFDVGLDSDVPETALPDVADIVALDVPDVAAPDAVSDAAEPRDAIVDSSDAEASDAGEQDAELPVPTEFCNSGEDDDGDGAADCADEDCAENVWCVDAPSWVYYGVYVWSPTGESASVRAFRTDDLSSSVAVTPGELTEGVLELPLSITPDGRILMLEDRSDGDRETWLLDLETGERTQLLVRDGWTVLPIDWSGPRDLVGLCSRFGPPETKYCRVRLDEFEVDTYDYDPDDDSHATLSLDGTGLYITRVLEAPNPFRPGVFRAELVLLDLDSGVRTLVTESPPNGLRRVPALQGYLWGGNTGLELRDAEFEWVRDLQLPSGATIIDRRSVVTRAYSLKLYSWTGALLGEHDFRAFGGAATRYSRALYVTPSPISADAFVPFFLADD